MSQTTPTVSDKEYQDTLLRLAAKPYKKGPRVRAIEKEYQQFKALADECRETADDVYRTLRNALSTDDQKELLALFSSLITARPSRITPETYRILADKSKRAKALLRAESRRAKKTA